LKNQVKVVISINKMFYTTNSIIYQNLVYLHIHHSIFQWINFFPLLFWYDRIGWVSKELICNYKMKKNIEKWTFGQLYSILKHCAMWLLAITTSHHASAPKPPAIYNIYNQCYYKIILYLINKLLFRIFSFKNNLQIC